MKFELDPEETKTVLEYVEKYITQKNSVRVEHFRELLDIIRSSGAHTEIVNLFSEYIKTSKDIKNGNGEPFTDSRVEA